MSCRSLRSGAGTDLWNVSQPPRRMVDDVRFRQVMGHFATGVAVVTATRPGGGPCGLTANSVASVSLRPLLMLVCVDRRAHSHDAITGAGSFAVSVLAAGDEWLARRFSLGQREERFEGLSFRTEETGSPVLDDALAWLDCRVHDVHEGGDHSIVVGEVLACGAREGEPLVFFRGEYRRMEP